MSLPQLNNNIYNYIKRCWYFRPHPVVCKYSPIHTVAALRARRSMNMLLTGRGGGRFIVINPHLTFTRGKESSITEAILVHCGVVASPPPPFIS